MADPIWRIICIGAATASAHVAETVVMMLLRRLLMLWLRQYKTKESAQSEYFKNSFDKAIRGFTKQIQHENAGKLNSFPFIPLTNRQKIKKISFYKKKGIRHKRASIVFFKPPPPTPSQSPPRWHLVPGSL